MQADQSHPGKALQKTRLQLRGQIDLGNQQQRLRTACDGSLDQAEVHLGLPTSRNTVKQPGRKRSEGRRDLLDRFALLACQFRTLLGPNHRRNRRRGGAFFDPSRFNPLPQQRRRASR
jgi:hypothetical protein